jgi:hypothetical protein|eukprot:COSAG01_NODE_7197_length_3308_cov_9.694609_5_plen_77_part_00
MCVCACVRVRARVMCGYMYVLCESPVQVLRDGLSGVGSRAVMIATLSPASACAGHTINTLRYADRLKEIGKATRQR